MVKVVSFVVLSGSFRAQDIPKLLSVSGFRDLYASGPGGLRWRAFFVPLILVCEELTHSRRIVSGVVAILMFTLVVIREVE